MNRAVVALTLLTLAGAVAAGAWRIAVSFARFYALWEEIASQFRNNGGSSLVDRVEKIESGVAQIRSEIAGGVVPIDPQLRRDRSG